MKTTVFLFSPISDIIFKNRENKTTYIPGFESCLHHFFPLIKKHSGIFDHPSCGYFSYDYSTLYFKKNKYIFIHAETMEYYDFMYAYLKNNKQNKFHFISIKSSVYPLSSAYSQIENNLSVQFEFEHYLKNGSLKEHLNYNIEMPNELWDLEFCNKNGLDFIFHNIWSSIISKALSSVKSLNFHYDNYDPINYYTKISKILPDKIGVNDEFSNIEKNFFPNKKPLVIAISNKITKKEFEITEMLRKIKWTYMETEKTNGIPPINKGIQVYTEYHIEPNLYDIIVKDFSNISTEVNIQSVMHDDNYKDYYVIDDINISENTDPMKIVLTLCHNLETGEIVKQVFTKNAFYKVSIKHNVRTLVTNILLNLLSSR